MRSPTAIPVGTSCNSSASYLFASPLEVVVMIGIYDMFHVVVVSAQNES